MKSRKISPKRFNLCLREGSRITPDFSGLNHFGLRKAKNHSRFFWAKLILDREGDVITIFVSGLSLIWKR